MKNTKRLVLLGLYVSLALALNLFERSFIVPLALPGAKLGLANIITLTLLLTMGFKDAFTVLVTRIVLGALLGSGPYGMLYSLSGGLLSLVIMYGLTFVNKDRISEIGISILGAFAHNVGQILMAALVINNLRIFSYLPVLFTSALFTGLFIGYVTKFLVKIQIISNLNSGYK